MLRSSIKLSLRSVFIVLTVVSSLYVLFIKTHLFVSHSSVLIKNIDGGTQTPSLIGMIAGQSSDTTQDAMVVQEYLRSYEMFERLDSKFNLTSHYSSSNQDIYQRLYSWNTYEDYLEFYNQRLEMTYDEVSSILNISFLHTDPTTSNQIVEFLIIEAEDKLNIYNQSIAAKHLGFITTETNKYKMNLDKSIKKLEEYQNRYNFIDPSNSAASSIEIISSLKANLVEKQTSLRKLKIYQTDESIEVVNLSQEIKQIKKSIEDLGKNLSGKSKSRINKNIFEYEQLKADVDLQNELYKQSLLQLQSAKVDVNKSSKTMQILVNPSKSSSYSQPNKIKELISILLVMSILYGIISMLIAIVKDHRE